LYISRNSIQSTVKCGRNLQVNGRPRLFSIVEKGKLCCLIEARLIDWFIHSIFSVGKVGTFLKIEQTFEGISVIGTLRFSATGTIF